WIKLDDQFVDHPKLRQLGPLGIVLQVRALCYAARYLTDGWIPHRIAWDSTADFGLLQATGEEPVASWFITPDDMVKAGVWESREGQYWIHDYLQYNPSREQELARRARDAARKHPNGKHGGSREDSAQ